jgi:hypothetical protein
MFSPQGLLWKLKPRARRLLEDLLEHVRLPEQALALKEWHERVRLAPSRSTCPTTGELFFRCAERLCWQRGSPGGMSYLMLNVVGLWEDDPELFELGGSRRVGQGSRSVTAVVKSRSFQQAVRKFQALCGCCEPLVVFERDCSFEDFPHPQRYVKLNVVAFHMYLRCCTGPARHYVVDTDLLERSLYGSTGATSREVQGALREALASIDVYAHWPVESCDIHRLSIEETLGLLGKVQQSVTELSKKLEELSRKVDDLARAKPDGGEESEESAEDALALPQTLSERWLDLCLEDADDGPDQKQETSEAPDGSLEMPVANALTAWTRVLTPWSSCCSIS